MANAEVMRTAAPTSRGDRLCGGWGDRWMHSHVRVPGPEGPLCLLLADGEAPRWAGGGLSSARPHLGPFCVPRPRPLPLFAPCDGGQRGRG